MIKIIRKDGTSRLVEIMKEKPTEKWRYVDLTSNQICARSYDSYNEALKSIHDEHFIKEWTYVTKKEEKHDLSGLFKYLGILLKNMFSIK